MIRRTSVIACVPLAAALLLGGLAAGQERGAEVRTWTGQTWRLTQPTFEVFYTVMPPPPENGAPGPPSGAGGTTVIVGQPFGGQRFSGTLQAQAASLNNGGREPQQGRRQRDTIDLTRDGVDVQVPIDQIDALVFTRAPVTTNVLPPYVASTHYRYAGRVVLTDGSIVEGDYVNLGTTILRGMTPQGRVDVPWDAIESVRFSR